MRKVTPVCRSASIIFMVLAALLLLPTWASAQLLMSDDFNSYSNASLSGQGSWVTLNSSNIVFTVSNSTPITYPCYNGGDGGRYVTPTAGGIPYIQRLSYPTTLWSAAADQVFYVSFLIRVTATGTDENAHIISLGNNFGGTNYDFNRIHVRTSGGGFNFGISEGSGTNLAQNSPGGIEWGSTVYTLNQTYLVVSRYDYDNGGGANVDAQYLWINPSIDSEPSTGDAEATIASGARGNDILFDGDNVQNIYLNTRDQSGVSPAYLLDGLRYARGATSAASWTNLAAAIVNTAPTISTTGSVVSMLSDNSTTLTVSVNDAQTTPASLVVTATSSNLTLLPNSGITVQVGGTTTRSISVTPAAGQTGTANIIVTVTDACAVTAVTTFSLTVLPNNHPPVFSTGANVTVNEDSGPYNAGFATGINDADGGTQGLTFFVSNNNNALFSVQPSVTTATGNLSFTPAANANGVATVSIYLRDTGTGSNTSTTQTFTIVVNSVNDAPSFSTGANVAVNENSGAYNAAFVTGINDGDPETTQTVSFIVNNDNNALFSVQPAIGSTTGSTSNLTFTPGVNAIGTAVVTVYAQDNGGTANGGVNTSATQTFVITVNAVNDAPVIAGIASFSMFEDASVTTVTLTGIGSGGGPDESSQTLTVTATSSNISIIPNPTVNYTSANVTGNLELTPVANATGVVTITVRVQDNGGTSNGGVDTYSTTFTVTVVPVNDAPSFSTGANVVVNENSGAYSAAFATGISDGDPESAQAVSFMVSNDNNALFSVQPAIGTTGTLSFTPAANINGVAVVSVYAQDNGGTANGGVNTSATQTFTITVNAVNSQPTVATVTSFSMFEDAPSTTVTLTGILSGPVDEAGQTLTVTATSSNISIIPDPTVNYTSANVTGNLELAPVANSTGTVTITVTVQDNGGTANGGMDTYSTTFTVTVVPVNDPPSFSTGANVVVNEDSGPYSAAFATGISDGDPESVQAVSFIVNNDNNALFSVQPAIGTTGTLSFTPAVNINGVAVVSVYAQDNGGTANGGVNTSATQTFTITVNAVNDAPTVATVTSFSMFEDAPSTTVTLTGILSGPVDEAGQTLTVTATSSNISIIPDPTVNYTSANVTGNLELMPVANSTGTVTITVTVQDNGGTANGGMDTYSTTFTVTVVPVNDAPSFSTGANVAINEDSGPYSAAFVTGINDGDPESAQNVSFVVTNANSSLFSVQPAISTTGVLSFTPAADANGVAVVSVYAQDDGGTANGGVNTSATQTFTITVNAVNDEPTIVTAQTVVSTNEDTAVLLTVALNDVDNTPGQLTVTATSANQSLIANAGIVQQGATGATTQILVTPVANQNGTTAVTVTVTDGAFSATTTFTVTVLPVNDAPTVTTSSASVSTFVNVPVTFAVFPADIDNAVGTLVVTATSSNQTIIPDGNLVQQGATGATTYIEATPLLNQSGIVVVTISVSDGQYTASTQLTVFVAGEPSISTTATALTFLEDGSTTLTVSVNDPDTPYSSLQVTATSSNQTLLPNANLVAVGTTGATTQFTATPVANGNGTAVVTLSVFDGIYTRTTAITLTVTPVNDAPSFSTGANRTVLEDAGPQTTANWATGISTGPADEAGQTRFFTVTNNNNALFAVQPAVSSTGTLTFTPATNANGVAVVSLFLTDNGGTANGGVATSATQTFVITVTPVNDAPSFVTGTNITVAEDAGAQTTANWATGISAGPADEAGQSVFFTVTNNHSSLFSVQPTVSSTGTLTFTAAPDSNGVAIVTLYLSDNGGTANGGVATSATQTFVITVTPVNDAPTISRNQAAIAIDQDVSTTLSVSIADIDNAVGTLVVTATSSNQTLLPNANFTQQGATGATTTLMLTPANNQYGTATITITVTDGGGLTATTTVSLSVNGRPVAVSTGLSLLEDMATMGTLSASDPEGQVLTYTVVTPATNGTVLITGVTTGTFTYTPNADINGSDSFVFQVSDGSLTSTATVSITIVPVNDAPSFSTGANLSVLDEAGAQTVSGYLTSISAGPVDESVQSIQFAVTNNNVSLFSVQPQISSTGTLTFTPAHWAQGSAVVSVYAMDNGGTANGGVNTSATQTFTITVGLSPATHLLVASVAPVPAQSGETLDIVVESYTALGTLRATTATTTLELLYDATWLPVLSGSTQTTLVAGASSATITVAFFSSSTANITTPITVQDVSGVLMSTSSAMTIEHAVPSVPTATTNNQQVALEWTAPVAQNVTGYVVFRGTSASVLVEIGTSATTSYVDNTVVNGTTYFYAVKSASSSLRSGLSGTIEVTVPLLAITSPNGGEMWQVGTTHAITWNTVSTIATVAVEYSLDNGGSWISLAASAPNTGSYSWFIQNPGSTEALVRVYDMDRPLVMDMSDNIFTIVPIAPVTGVTVSALVNGAQLQWNLSTSSGVTAYEVYHGLTSGTLSLLATVPSTVASYTHTGLDDGLSHYYALRTVVDGEQSAYSEEVTVIPNTMKVLYANGGEEFQPGTEEILRWQYSGDISSMVIEYSTDNGANWTSISQTVTFGGNKPLTVFTQEWTVVNVPTTTALIRVRSLAPIVMSDQSDATFTIGTLAPPTNLVATAGSTTIDLSWTASTSANVTGYRILRGTTSGNLTNLTDVGVVTSYVDTGATICTEYYYAVQALVTIAASESSNVTRAQIMLPESITVLTPNGGEMWQAGVTRTITWTSTGCTVPTMVTLSYSGDNGGSWSTIATVSNTGSYAWLLPNTPSTAALVQVSGGILSDNSNAVFTIAPIPAPTNLVAVAGNGAVQLNWNASSAEGLSGYGIYRGTTSGSLSLLTSVSSTATSYSDNSGTNCTLYVYAIRANVGAMSSDFSNEAVATPQIAPTLTLLSPNGGERWQVGVTHTIAWSSTGCTVPSSILLEYSINNGGSWSTIASVANSGMYAWVIPATPSESALVRISGGALSDMSNGVFAISEILPPTNLVATASSGSVGLTWNLSTAAGVTAQSIWRGTTSGTLSLLATVSSTATTYTDNTVTNCTMYVYAVTATVGAMNSAFSNQAMAIPQIVPAITVLSPNGGEVWHGGQSRMITWNSTSCSVPATVALSYSTNNGTSWTTIASVANSGSYAWTLPNTPSSQALVRVTGGALSDNSDAVFTILPTPVPVVTAVQPVVTTSFCSGSPSSVMVSVTLSDPIYPVSTLTLTAVSSNQSVVSNANIVRQGSTSATTTFMVTPNASTGGVAQLTFSASNGYASGSTSVSFSVTVNALPVASVSGSTSVCASAMSSYNVAPTTGANYRWTVNGGSITSGQGTNTVQVNWGSSGAGSVAVVVTSASLCTSTSSVSVSIRPNPVVTIATSGPTTFCPGGSVMLTAASTGVSYLWSNGSTAQSIVVNSSGNYSVVVSNGFGCNTLSTSVSVTVHPGVVVDAGVDVTTCSGSAVQLSGSGSSPVGGLMFSWSPAAGLSNTSIPNPMASPTTTTTYTLLVTDANGCSSSDQVTVVVRPPANVSVSSNAAICVGGSTQLGATGGVSYSWSPSTGLSNASIANPVASPTVTTTYTVAILSAGGCMVQRSVTVTVEARPVATAGSNVSVCAGGSVQLGATGGVSYSWSPATGLSNPNIANPIASPSTTTMYTVTVSNAGGCSSSASVTVTVSPVVLDVQVMLEGAYSGGGVMSTGLDAQGLVPVNQPYNVSPFNYMGTETRSVTSGTNVVDWVLVELRSGTGSGSMVDRRAGLLLSDGSIVSGDGSGLSYSSLTPGGSYYVVVLHRNHLSVMSSISVGVNGSCELPYNFTGSPSAAYMQFAEAQKQLSAGVYGMISGDPDANGLINAVDRVMTRNASGLTGYRIEDVSLDGIVNAVDRVMVRNNTFRTTQVP